jgi:hypothetical protein
MAPRSLGDVNRLFALGEKLGDPISPLDAALNNC